jgi:hypothetical protein
LPSPLCANSSLVLVVVLGLVALGQSNYRGTELRPLQQQATSSFS